MTEVETRDLNIMGQKNYNSRKFFLKNTVEEYGNTLSKALNQHGFSWSDQLSFIL